MFVVLLMVEQAEDGSTFPLEICSLIRLTGLRDPWMLILDFMKFEVSESIGLTDFLARLPAGFCSTTLAPFLCTPSLETPHRERCDGAIEKFTLEHANTWEDSCALADHGRGSPCVTPSWLRNYD